MAPLDLDTLEQKVDDSPEETEEELARRGVLPSDQLAKLTIGSVLIVKDVGVLDFPEDRLPSSGKRTPHEGRFVVVVQANSYTQKNSCRTLLVVPCSASASVVMPWDYEIPSGEPAFTKNRVVALCRLVQPILKVDFRRRTGVLSPTALGGLKAKLAQLVDLQLRRPARSRFQKNIARSPSGAGPCSRGHC
jgi:mRNA-degrading endonuclease toxin of MazEF toxin-antitoxin module